MKYVLKVDPTFAYSQHILIPTEATSGGGRRSGPEEEEEEGVQGVARESGPRRGGVQGLLGSRARGCSGVMSEKGCPENAQSCYQRQLSPA